MSPSSTMPSPGYNWSQKPRNRHEFAAAYEDALRLYNSIHLKMSLDELATVRHRLWEMGRTLDIREMYGVIGSSNCLPKDSERQWFTDAYWDKIYLGTKNNHTVVFNTRNDVFIPGDWVLDMYDLYKEVLEQKEKHRLENIERQRVRLLQELGVAQ